MDISTSIATTNQQTNYSKASNSSSNLNPNFYSNGMFLLCKFLKLMSHVILLVFRYSNCTDACTLSFHLTQSPPTTRPTLQPTSVPTVCINYLFYYDTYVNMFSSNAWHFYFIVYRHRLHSLQLGNQQARHLPRYVSTHHFGLSEFTFKHNSIPCLR